MKNKNGITLIALVITIIILLILSGVSINAIIGDNGILSQSQSASIIQRLATYKEELEMSKVDLEIEKISNNSNLSDLKLCIIGEDVKKYIPSLIEEDIGKISIFDDNIVYTDNNITKEIENAVKTMNITFMSVEDYNYIVELHYLEVAIANHAKDNVKIGIELGTSENGYVTIAGINYGLGWHEISTDDELKSLGLTDKQLSLMTHKPYIVKYNTGAVQCISGKLMYAGLENEIWKYTFNYTGEENGIVVEDLLNGITANSTKTEEQFGNMIPTQQYATSGTTAGVIENYYQDSYKYDEYGGLILEEKTNIAITEISPETNIGNEFTTSITVKADLSQTGIPSSAVMGTIMAISSNQSKWTMVLGIRNNRLCFISYHNQSEYGSALGSTMKSNIEGEYKPGFGILGDVSKYSEKFLNIQMTAKRGENTRIYLNGELQLEINSGASEFSYDSITLGDLRPGRGYKFVGTIYNYGLYGKALTEDQIAQNWNAIKEELKINEAGERTQ